MLLESLGEDKISSIVNLQKIVARASFDIEKLKNLTLYLKPWIITP